MPTLRQGPKAGRHWPAEATTYDDPETGATVHRLTDYPGSDNRHLYFTEEGRYDDGRRLLFRGVREGDHDLFAVDLETHLITQLTDLPEAVSGVTTSPAGDEAYFWCGDRLVGLDLHDLDVWTAYERGGEYADYDSGKPGVTADGETVCFQLVERAVERPTFSGNRAADDDEKEADEDRGSWMARMHDADPHSVLLAVPAQGGESEVLHEEDRWLGHVNTSPTRADRLTYCHEGPWDEVDERIWGLDRETGETWAVRETGDDEAVGHEFWLADGERVGYHGWRGDRDDPEAFFGVVDHEGGEPREVPAPDIYTHFHANDTGLVVGDGSHRGIESLLVWTESDGEFRGPRRLASHDWSGDDDAHPHARVGPNDETVVFDSTRAGDGSDVYLVEVPDFEDLPELGDYTLE